MLLPRIAAPLHDYLDGAAPGAGAHPKLVATLCALLLLTGLTLLASIMCAGLWRFILRGVPITKPYYFGIGDDERRLAVLAALKALLLGAWACVAALLIGAAMFVAAYLSAPGSPATFAITGLISLLALSWLATRLSLSGPATISVQRVSVAASWHATAHNVTRLQRVAALLMVPVSLLVVVLLLLLLLILVWWWSSAAPLAATGTEVARICAALLRYLWPLVLLLLYLLFLFVAALFIVARALEYQAIGPPPGAPI